MPTPEYSIQSRVVACAKSLDRPLSLFILGYTSKFLNLAGREIVILCELTSGLLGFRVWQVCGFGLQLRSQEPVRQGIHEVEGLLYCMFHRFRTSNVGLGACLQLTLIG